LAQGSAHKLSRTFRKLACASTSAEQLTAQENCGDTAMVETAQRPAHAAEAPIAIAPPSSEVQVDGCDTVMVEAAQHPAQAAEISAAVAATAPVSPGWRHSKHHDLPGLDGLDLLSDTQMQQFIVEGYLELPPLEHEVESMDAAFHQKVFDSALALGDRAELLGNNILPALPELNQVFESRRCRGALTSLLGPGYIMHPHRFCHKSEPGREAQRWHRDSFWGNWHPRNQCPYWVMALYFPQDTPVELGPTGILPRSQYYNKHGGKRNRVFGCGRFSDTDVADGVPSRYWHVKERPLACCAGTVVLIHYDLWHRGAANVTMAGVRFMFKFQFSRMVSPVRAPCSWDCSSIVPDWTCFLTANDSDEANAVAASGYFLRPVWQGIWDWLCGCEAGSATAHSDNKGVGPDIGHLVRELVKADDHNEPHRVAIAWRIGRLAAQREDQASILVIHLESVAGLQSQGAMQALEAAGQAVLLPLIETQSLNHSPGAIRALGRIFDTSKGSDGVDKSLAALAADRLCSLYSAAADTNLRLCVGEALGCVPQESSAHMLLRIVAEDGSGDVRATSCHSILRLLSAGSLHEDVIETVYTAMLTAQQDPDRYVAAYSAEIVHRIGHRLYAQKSQAIPPLVRWCTCGDGWQANGNNDRMQIMIDRGHFSSSLAWAGIGGMGGKEGKSGRWKAKGGKGQTKVP